MRETWPVGWSWSPLCQLCAKPLYTMTGPRGERVYFHRNFDTGCAEVPILGGFRWVPQPCDFCGYPEVAWLYEVSPVTPTDPVRARPISGTDGDGKRYEVAGLPISTGANDTPWLACSPCDELIQQNAWGGVLRRWFKETSRTFGARPTDAQKLGAAHLHETYRNGRTGRRMLVTRGDTPTEPPPEWDRE